MASNRLSQPLCKPSKAFLLSTAIILLSISINEAQQTPPKFEEFVYDMFSPLGPEGWGDLELENNEYLQYTAKHGGQTLYDLDVEENECGRTSKQSPVNLLPNEICLDDHEILSRKIRRSDCKFDDFSWSITPHFLRATMPPDDSFCIRPHIDLPNGFGNKWNLQFMELHIRAEHTLDGRRYDAELQMVHLGLDPNHEKLATISMMLEASSPEDDEMVQWMLDEWQAVADRRDSICNNLSNISDATSAQVRGGRDLRGSKTPQSEVEVEKPSNEFVPARVHRHLNPSTHPAHSGEEERINEELETLDPDHPRLYYGSSYRTDEVTGEIHRVLQIDDDNDVDADGNEIKVVKAPRHKMFPYIMWPTIWYYRYRGSITSPPCSKIVNWRVLDTPRAISPRQLRQLAALLQGYRDADTCELATQTRPVNGENWRPVNPLGDNIDQPTVHCERKNFWFWRYDPEDQ